MPVDKYKFISPGVFIHEIDNTGLTALPQDVGPVLIGRAEKGPILKPIQVGSYADFITTFGSPVPGSKGGDIARDGNYSAPTYASYAAQAWLRNNSPVTFVRLGGQKHVNAADPAGLAGWQTAITTASPLGATNGGAFGLFVVNSGTMGLTGTLAAVFYLNQNLEIALSGTNIDGTGEIAGTSRYIRSVGLQQFKIQIADTTGAPPTTIVDTKFDFTPTSDTFIRKVFNTNPTLTNNNVVDTGTESLTEYWLGETFEGNVAEVLTGTAGSHLAVLLFLRDATNFGGEFRKDYQDAETGIFFSQDMSSGPSATGSYLPANMQALFKLVARNSGDWATRNLKVSIKDIKRSSDTFNHYGSFTVALRKMSDTDNRVDYVEQYNNCNLNPNSENYIARKIGDKFVTWDDENRRYREFGDYPNLSQFIRVDVNEKVANGNTDPELLPFGVRGPLRFIEFNDTAANTIVSFVSGNFNGGPAGVINTFISGTTNGNLGFDFPKLRLRISASEGDPVDPKNVFFGADTTFNSSRFNESVLDILKIKPTDIPDFTTQANTEVSYFFTLDDMCNTNTGLSGTNVYVSGSRRAAKATSGLVTGNDVFYSRGTGSYNRVIETAGANQFTTVFFGGFDGLNIQEAEPFRESFLNNTPEPTNNYAMNSLQVAIDSIRDPEVIEYNLAAMPGIKNNTLNKSLVDMCESRGDAMAVIDLRHDYISAYECATTCPEPADRLPNVTQAILNVRNELQLNSSYGAAYFPWVQIRDITNGQFVWVPPSVAALGAISYSQKASELWFAPAGFTRGGLSSGHAGIPVVSVRKRLTSKERDKLYDANINPIAQFPAEGIVIFGQKTLQATQSALDRINVRRLLIFLKREISRFASTLLFDQNVRTTWNRFRSVVEPFLSSVQARLGITNFKLILDETTTTPDLIDRNILYAKVYIKPAYAIEYIAIDFILTDSGAAFED